MIKKPQSGEEQLLQPEWLFLPDNFVKNRTSLSSYFGSLQSMRSGYDYGCSTAGGGSTDAILHATCYCCQHKEHAWAFKTIHNHTTSSTTNKHLHHKNIHKTDPCSLLSAASSQRGTCVPGKVHPNGDDDM